MQAAEARHRRTAAAQLVEPGAAIGISAGTTTSSSPARCVRRPRPDRGHQLGPGRPAAPRVRRARPDRRAHRRRAHPVRRPGRPGRRGRPAHAARRPLFLGVHGMDARAGFTTPNLVEAETNRALVDAARQVCVARRPHQVGHRRLSARSSPLAVGRRARHRRRPRRAGPAPPSTRLVAELVVAERAAHAVDRAGRGQP